MLGWANSLRPHCLLMQIGRVFRGAIWVLCFGWVAMLLIETAAVARTSDEPDPRMLAFAFARGVGELEAHAEMCAAPSVAYESTARDAIAILPDQYRKVGLDPSDIERDIAKGKADILAMHQANPSWPPSVPSCLGFNGLVANLRCWILIAQGTHSCPPPPPPNISGWQDQLGKSLPDSH